MNIARLPAIVKREISSAELPPTYEKAKAALAECARLDECKEWINRMAAMASYAKQAKDTSMEELALRIRRRAERRLGELLAELPTSKPGSGRTGERTRAAQSIGMHQTSAAQLVRISTVPKQTFEEKIEQSPVPSLRQLDPGWSASLAPRIRGGHEALSVYSELQAALSPLNRLILEKRTSAKVLAKQIRDSELPSEYMDGLKHSALIVSEWLDELERHLRR